MKIKKYLTIPLMASLTLGAATVTSAANDYQITDKPLDLTIHMHFRDKYAWDSNWPVAKEIARLTNINLEGVASKSGTNSKELFNLMLVSGDLPDIVGGDALKESFNQYGMEGAFVPLNDLIEKHAPNIKKFLDAHPIVKSAVTAPDGNIYFMPYIPDGKPGRGYFIRQDWLDKLGLEVPTNIDELYDVLVAFRDNDPNGNGKKDEVPFFNREPEEAIRLVTFFGARSTGSDSYHDFLYEPSGVTHPYTTEAFKYGISQVAKWYKEGLIDKEIYTRKNKARDQLLGNDVGGFTHDWFASTAGYNDKLADDIPGFKFLPILPPADVNGRVMEEHGRAIVKPDGWAITVANKHPVETIKLFDFYFTELGRTISNFGVEGLTYDMVNGKPQFKDSVLNGDTGVLNQMWDIGAQIPIGFYQDYDYEVQWTNPIAMAGINEYVKADVILEPFPGLTMNVKEKKVFDKYWPNIEAYILEQTQLWVLGSGDVNEDWDDYLKKLDKLKLDEVLKVLNSAYNRQYK
ncbi:MAG: extracellular solute-binding protein [Reinekea sp.]|jgi:putative aldouronate transport system substrate-binding protein|nr:extracellular solute-binding protein [Reinekea sp.]